MTGYVLFLLQQAVPAVATLMSLYYVKHRFDETERRHRIECERLVDMIRCLAPGQPPKQLSGDTSDSITVTDPPVLRLEAPPSPLPVARALKT